MGNIMHESSVESFEKSGRSQIQIKEDYKKYGDIAIFWINLIFRSWFCSISVLFSFSDSDLKS